MHQIKAMLHLIAVILLLCTTAHVHASNYALHEKYNERHPLVFSSPWDFPPYCFQDNQNGPQGYSIDLLKEITRRLDLPIIFKLCPAQESYQAFKTGKSDISISLYNDTIHTDKGFYGQQITNTMSIGYIEPKNKPSGIKDLYDLYRHHFFVNKYSIVSYTLDLNHKKKNVTIINDPKNTVLNMAAADSGIVVWHYYSLLYLKRIYHLDNMQVKPINMQLREYRFLARDSMLIAAFDSVMGQMRAEESFAKIENKWLYPDREKATSNYNWEVIAGSSFFILLVTLFMRLFYIQYKRNLQIKRKTANDKLQNLTKEEHLRLFVYNDKTKKFDIEISGEFMSEAARRITKEIQKIKMGESTHSVFVLNGKRQGHYYDKEFTISRYNEQKYDDPRFICIMRDVTEERIQQKKGKENALRFQAEFETSSLDIIYFNADGQLSDMNAHACKTFGYQDKEAVLSTKLTIDEMDIMHEFDTSSKDNRWAVGKFKHHGKDMYYDSIVTPVLGEDKQTMGFFVIGKDITEQVRKQKQHKATIRELEEATQKMYQYLKQANVSLTNNGISIITYHLNTHILDFGQAFDKEMKHYTQTQWLEMIDEQDLPIMFHTFNNCDNSVDEPFHLQIKTKRKNEAGDTIIWAINGFPIKNEQGKVDHYFGTKQDVTEIVKMDKMIAEETAKAKDAERLKDVFLQNISHDVRTPLNAIVGFAKMLTAQYKQEERDIFVEQIRQNTQKLLYLVNNILLLSRLDANMVDSTQHQFDMVEEFQKLCDKVIQEHIFQKDQFKAKIAYKTLIVKVDGIHLTSILSQLLQQLAIYLGKGKIRMRCFATKNELMVSMETTGGGIPVSLLKDSNSNNYTSDENGTKIVLSNCKRLTKLIGGRMEIQDNGHISTVVWVNVPCQMIENSLKHINNN